jgi:hypothetical protein
VPHYYLPVYIRIVFFFTGTFRIKMFELLRCWEFQICGINGKMATCIVHNEDVARVFTRKTVEDDEVRCQCCVKLEIELNEVISELKSATEII